MELALLLLTLGAIAWALRPRDSNHYVDEYEINYIRRENENKQT